MDHFIRLLDQFLPSAPEEVLFKKQMMEFASRHSNCFSRECLEGHFTGSAFVLHPDLDKVLLIHHKKLNKWLQPGGHCDGIPDPLLTAVREVFEETGIQASPLIDSIFDLDIHPIPERKNEPAHLHLDVRFLLKGKNDIIRADMNEVNECDWVSLQDIGQKTAESSMLRMAEKVKKLF